MAQTLIKLIHRLSLGIALIAMLGIFQEFGGIVFADWVLVAAVSLALAWLAYGRMERPVASGDFAKALDIRQNDAATAATRQSLNPQSGSISFRGAPVTVVGLNVACGGAGMNSDDWKWHITLEPWRIKGGNLQESALQIAMPGTISEKEFEKLQEDFRGEQVVELQVFDIRDPSSAELDGKEAWLAAIVSIGVEDEELLHVLENKYQPFEIEAEGIGKLSYLPDEGHCSGKVAWMAGHAGILVETDKREELLRCVDATRPLFDNVASWDMIIREYVAMEMLKEENKPSLKPQYRNLSKDEFMQRLAVDTFVLMEEGDFLVDVIDRDAAHDLKILAQGNVTEGMACAELY